MQANSADHYPFDTSSMVGSTPVRMDGSDPGDDSLRSAYEPTFFHSYYTSCMEMYADAETVASYLDAHRDWFRRCAHPMKTEPLGQTGYALIIGKFGSFGYEVEPKIGLDLLPQNQGIYRIQTIPLDEQMPGYDVDFQAAMHLVEADPDMSSNLIWESQDTAQVPAKMTRVEWDLNLKVTIQFPRFIHALPKSLIQTTGDRLLLQIVRQVSRRLTNKVQDDFHHSRGISFPKKRKKMLWSRNSDTAHIELSHGDPEI